MRLLIVSPKDRLSDSLELSEALGHVGVETLCIHDRDYYALSEYKILKHVPFPRLLGLVRRFRPDFTFLHVPYYTAHMAKLVSQPLLIHLEGDIWTEFQWKRHLYGASLRRIVFEWENLVIMGGITKADLILPVSRWLEETAKQHLPKYPMHVLYKGFDPEKWRVKPNMDLLKLKRPAAVGVFDFEIFPKVAGFLKFVKCLEKLKDVNFYFAGNGVYMGLVKRNSPSNVHFLGKLSRSEVRRLLASGDLFVHPSGMDSLSKSTAEASLMEKPIVASNVGGIPEVVENGKTGYLCDIDDTELWVEKIRFLLDNPNVAEKLGKNARKSIMEKFVWGKIAKDLVERLTRGEHSGL